VRPAVSAACGNPIVFTAAAAIFSGAGSWAHEVKTWLTVGTVLGILAAVLPAILRLRKRQVLWVRTRTAAEVCRSVLAFWRTPAHYEAIGPEVVPELSGVLMSLNFLKMVDRERSQSSLGEFKQRYRQERIAGQIDYFFRHAAQSAAEARRYRAATWISIGFAAAVNVWLFVSGHFSGIFALGPWKQSLSLGAFNRIPDRNHRRSIACGQRLRSAERTLPGIAPEARELGYAN